MLMSTLPSSVVNGLATITLGLILNLMAALITDECPKDPSNNNLSTRNG